MKTYTKAHKSTKAAKGHAKNIKKRGGKVKSTSCGNTTVLEYKFKK